MAARDGWEADAVRGRLFDLGPYPGLVDLDDPGAHWVDGYVRPVDRGELIDRLDPYEGVDEGLYRREATTTRAGRPGWIYVYARPLPRVRPRADRAGEAPRASTPDLPSGDDDGHLSRPRRPRRKPDPIRRRPSASI